MNFENWVQPIIPPLIIQPPRFNFQSRQKNSFRDNWSGVSSDFEREVKVSPGKYEVKESRKFSVDPPLRNTLSSEIKQAQNKKKPAIGKRKKTKVMKPTARVKMEIYLERFETGVFVTRVRVGKRVRWQNVKYEKQALRYHPAIKNLQTVMTAVETMRDHRTIQISLARDEAERYKAGEFLEGTNKKQPKSKKGIICHQVNNCYQQNNYLCNAGPSTSTRYIEDNNDESSGTDSEFDTD